MDSVDIIPLFLFAHVKNARRFAHIDTLHIPLATSWAKLSRAIRIELKLLMIVYDCQLSNSLKFCCAILELSSIDMFVFACVNSHAVHFTLANISGKIRQVKWDRWIRDGRCRCRVKFPWFLWAFLALIFPVLKVFYSYDFMYLLWHFSGHCYFWF